MSLHCKLVPVIAVAELIAIITVDGNHDHIFFQYVMLTSYSNWIENKEVYQWFRTDDHILKLSSGFVKNN